MHRGETDEYAVQRCCKCYLLLSPACEKLALSTGTPYGPMARMTCQLVHLYICCEASYFALLLYYAVKISAYIANSNVAYASNAPQGVAAFAFALLQPCY